MTRSVACSSRWWFGRWNWIDLFVIFSLPAVFFSLIGCFHCCVVVFSIHRAHGVGFTQRALFSSLSLCCVCAFFSVEFAFSCHVKWQTFYGSLVLLCLFLLCCWLFRWRKMNFKSTNDEQLCECVYVCVWKMVCVYVKRQPQSKTATTTTNSIEQSQEKKTIQ